MTRPPLTATYRLQLSHAFRIPDAKQIVPYLARLGVSHVYSSPLLEARPGSTHGYDVIDPSRLNPEVGTQAELEALVAELRHHDMGLVLDIVPNHMAVDHRNPFWADVLRHGERSRFAGWFDIDWEAEPDRRIVLPVLGHPAREVLERGELRVEIREDAVDVAYFDRRFPIDPASLPPELQLARWDPAAREAAVHAFGDKGSATALAALLDGQHYRLVDWRTGADRINYRRFFDVSDLVGVRVEDPEVFAATHAMVFEWIEMGLIDGLRVDHVDGLHDPAGYLARLRNEVDSRAGSHLPIFVEKILADGERLRADWPVDGTTGYEFLNEAEELFLDPDGFASIERSYRRLRRRESLSFADIARSAKLRLLRGALAPDVRRVARPAMALARDAVSSGEAGSDWTAADVIEGTARLMAAMPVYRTYLTGSDVPSDEDRRVIAVAVAGVMAQSTPTPEAGHSMEAARFLGDALVDRTGRGLEDRTQLIHRFQQTSSPAMAKGVEDTALYDYIPLVSRNEVGGAPDRTLAQAIERFDRSNAIRAERWPHSLLCTNTHDTKRSGDLRARLDVLSEIPDEWQRSLVRWRRLNRKHRTAVRGRLAPDTNTEYLVYQVLVGLWPAPRQGRRRDDLPDRPWREAISERLQSYVIKAAREAKLRTTWTDPDIEFEKATVDFVRAILRPGDDAPFLTDVSRLVSTIAPAAHWNSIARVALHLTSPGTPDIYQGDEMWNISLVDPDNRRPVDYGTHARELDGLSAAGNGAAGGDWRSLPKLRVTTALLNSRRRRPDIFSRGTYQPLRAGGPRGAHVIAFARTAGEDHAVTIAARLSHTLTAASDDLRWVGTRLGIPDHLRGRSMREVISGRESRWVVGEIPVADLLGDAPAACWMTRAPESPDQSRA